MWLTEVSSSWLTSWLHILYLYRYTARDCFLNFLKQISYQGSHSAVESEEWWVTCLAGYMLVSRCSRDWSTASALYLGCHSPKKDKQSKSGERRANRQIAHWMTTAHLGELALCSLLRSKCLPENRERESQVTAVETGKDN